jgi:hypothetical protein
MFKLDLECPQRLLGGRLGPNLRHYWEVEENVGRGGSRSLGVVLGEDFERLSLSLCLCLCLCLSVSVSLSVLLWDIQAGKQDPKAFQEAMLISMPAETQCIHIRRLSPKNKGVLPSIFL